MRLFEIRKFKGAWAVFRPGDSFQIVLGFATWREAMDYVAEALRSFGATQ